MIVDLRREDSLQASLGASQVDGLAAVNSDEARLGSLRLANICDGHHVNIRSTRILGFREVHG